MKGIKSAASTRKAGGRPSPSAASTAKPPKKNNSLGIDPEHWATTAQICAEAVRRSGTRTALLSFSGGKDSVTCWLGMQEFFDRIVPVYFYLVPGLQFVEQALTYYEDQFKTPINRIPSPARMRWLLKFAEFQPPDRLTALEAIRQHLPKRDVKWTDIANDLRRRHDCLDAYHATGIKALDSVVRRTVYRKRGAFSGSTDRMFYPVITWSQDDIEACLDAARFQLPPEYHFFGRSVDLFAYRYRFLAPLVAFYPDDARRIFEDFPLAELELYRRWKSSRAERFGDRAWDAWGGRAKWLPACQQILERWFIDRYGIDPAKLDARDRR